MGENTLGKIAYDLNHRFVQRAGGGEGDRGERTLRPAQGGARVARWPQKRNPISSQVTLAASNLLPAAVGRQLTVASRVACDPEAFCAGVRGAMRSNLHSYIPHAG